MLLKMLNEIILLVLIIVMAIALAIKLAVEKTNDAPQKDCVSFRNNI